MYCEDGIAFADSKYNGKCSKVDKVFHDGVQLEAPYQCDPTDNEKWCTLYYNTTQWKGGDELAEFSTF